MKEIPIYRFFKHKYSPELLVDVVDVKRMAPGIRRMPTYIQTFFALMFVAEGEQRVEVNGRGMTVSRGIVICARPCEVWSWDDEVHIEALTLTFEEEFLLSFFNDPHFIERFPYLCAGCLSPFLFADRTIIQPHAYAAAGDAHGNQPAVGHRPAYPPRHALRGTDAVQPRRDGGCGG